MRVRRDVVVPLEHRLPAGRPFSRRPPPGIRRGRRQSLLHRYLRVHRAVRQELRRAQPRHNRGTIAFFARPSYDSATAHAHVRYGHLGDHVADNINAIGFITDDDRRELDGAISKTIWVREGAIERMQYSSNYNVYWGQKGLLRSWKVDESLGLDWRNRWSTSVSHTEEFKRFEKDFRNRQTEVELGFNTRSYESLRGAYSFGRNFGADFQLWTAAATYTLTEQLSTEYELQRLDLDPDPADESTWIHVVRANQFFTPDPVPARLLPDQLGDRPTEHAGGLRLPVSASVRHAAGRLSARDRGVRRTLRSREHAARQAHDRPVTERPE